MRERDEGRRNCLRLWWRKKAGRDGMQLHMMPTLISTMLGVGSEYTKSEIAYERLLTW